MGSTGTRTITSFLSAAGKSTLCKYRRLGASAVHTVARSTGRHEILHDRTLVCLRPWTHRRAVTLEGLTGELARQPLPQVKVCCVPLKPFFYKAYSSCYPFTATRSAQRFSPNAAVAV